MPSESQSPDPENPEPQAEAHPCMQFDLIIAPHLPAAYSLARFLTRSSEAAEDLCQDAFLRAFRSLDTFRGGDARAWILTIVRNLCHSWMRTQRSQPTVVSLHGNERAAAATSPEETSDEPACDLNLCDFESPERALIRVAEVEEIRAILCAIPQPFQEVLILRELEDLTYRQIAEMTGAPLGTVMSRLSRARELFLAAWSHRQEADRPHTSDLRSGAKK
jgi:RNA polymerase sigma-70 factor (ECF subfamily)